MKPVLIATLACLLLGGTVARADRLRDEGPAPPTQKHSKGQVAGRVTRGDVTEPCFSSREVQIIREYYAPQYRALPPGLQKKLRRTGQLPPGWQKKFHPFPLEVERQLVVLPAGYRRGVIEGHAVIFNERTRVMLDVAVLF